MVVVLDYNEIKNHPYISSSFTPPTHPHSHLFFELTFCVKGSSINTINGNPFSFQNGRGAILKPGDVHSLTQYDEHPYEHVDLYATEEYFKKTCDAIHPELFNEIISSETLGCFPISNECFTYLFNQSLLLKEMIVSKNKFFEIIYSSMLTTILSEWIKNKVFHKNLMPTWLSNLLPKFNDVTFVQKNVTQIAQEIGFSLPYFSTQFKKHLGVSAIEYLTKKRIHLSKDLIARNTELRILDISYMLGFENPSTFSKHFLQEFKVTPKEYRKKSLSNIDL